jgi:FkbM family methyltransferase
MDDTKPVVCRARITDNIAFEIAVDPDAAAGRGGHPPDPISQAYLNGMPNLNLTLLRLMQAILRPGGVMLDVGAHLGTFALTAAAHGCLVVGVEANPRNVALLRESVRRNGWQERVQVIHAAASDAAGELAFSAYGPWGHVASAKTGIAALPCPAARLDDVLAACGVDRVDFIKIDVEGSEIAALTGAEMVLGSAPAVLYESNHLCLDWYGRTPRELRAALDRFGYRHHYLVRPDRLVSVTADDFQAEICGEYLATKKPVDLPGWRIETGLPRREMVRMLTAELRRNDRHCLAQLGRALREAPPELLAENTVRRLLRCLKGNAHAEVRAAAHWSAEPPRGTLGHLVDRIGIRLGI